MGSGEVFPRELFEVERKLLLWVLPADRIGYERYRKAVGEWKVIGARSWVEGAYLVGPVGKTADREYQSQQVVAIGAVNGPRGAINITVREIQSDLMEFEVAGFTDTDLLLRFDELAKWTLSSWSPGSPCPSCGDNVREVAMITTVQREFRLVVCAGDQKLWFYNAHDETSRPLPVTGYYNELMFQAGINEPGRALQSRRLFTDLDEFSDAQLTRAFEAYNRLRQRTGSSDVFLVQEENRKSWLRRLGRHLFKPRG